MRTGELAEQAGVHVETLRYYERRGLLEAPERSPSGYRSYSAVAVRVARFVKRAQEVGFTFDDVAELLDLADGGAESCDVARTTAASRLKDLDQRIADLTAMRGALASLVQTCETTTTTNLPTRRCPQPRRHGGEPIMTRSASTVRAQILQVPDCPLVDELHALVHECLTALGDSGTVETRVGDHPSPTLVIDGIDVATGGPIDDRVCCRLDLPSREQILNALQKSSTS